MINPQLNYNNLSKEEYKTYARHLILSKIGIRGQQRIKKARVLCIGAGGLGCPAILYLVRSGIGYLGIIDNDIVSLSNLHRQIIYKYEDINNLKTISTKYRIKNTYNNCKIYTYSYTLNINNAYNIIKEYDIIVDASDNFETRYIIDSICYILHKIHIYGAIENFEGQVSVFNYKNGPKYSDVYPKTLNLENYKCNNTGVLGVLTGTIGILQATEAIKIITGIGQVLSGYILIYNALNTSFKKIKIPLRKYNIKTLKKNTWQTNNIISTKDLKKKL